MTSDASMLAAPVRLSEHVAHRSFGEETVVVNLKSGKYHGLNRTAARMLELAIESPTLEAAIPRLAGELGVDRVRLERDLLELCRGLEERGLVEIG